jgi:glycosyltransferase involved in cell wall biosynthesis
MHIGMILDTEHGFPTHIRVEKEIAALSLAGHKVTVLTRLISDEAPLKEDLPWENVTVVRVPIRDAKGSPSKIINRLRMIEPTWIRPLAEFVEKEKPDILHIHDLLLVPTALQIGSQFGLPIVADLHENMPAAMRAYRANASFKVKLISSVIYYNYQVMRWHEARYLKRCVRVIVVVPEAAERLYDYGLSKDQIVVVSNTEDETTFPFEQVDPIIQEEYEAFWTVTYIGSINPHRGLDTTLRAVSLIGNQISDIRLLIVGARAQDKRQILSMASDLGIEDIIDIICWQPFQKINSYIMASDICLVPHNDFEHTQTTVPHKLFQYMICGKPVLVSDCKPLARIVEETRSGLIFEANNEKSLANKLLFMRKHPELLIEMGLNGQQAALGKYAWRNDAERLIEIYERLTAQISKR